MAAPCYICLLVVLEGGRQGASIAGSSTYDLVSNVRTKDHSFRRSYFAGCPVVAGELYLFC